MAKTQKHSRRKRRLSLPASAPHRAESYSDRDRLLSEQELQLTQARMREEELQRALGEIEKRNGYYSGLFNSAPVGYAVFNRIGAILEINQAGASLLRWTRDRLISESFARFVPKEQLAEFLKHLRVSKSGEKPVTTELLVRAHDGQIIPVELVSTSFTGPDQTILYRTAIIDITERRRAEQALQETQRHYRELVDSIEGIVWEGNASGITFISRQAERMFGYPMERWVRESDFCENRVHPDDREEVLNVKRQAILEGRNFVQEFRMTTSNRRVLWLRNNVTVTREPDGRVRLQGVMVNITEIKEAYEALREQARTLETLNRIGTSLIAELDVEKLVQVVTEAGRELTNARFGAFSYKLPNGQGEHTTLFTTSGASPETFERLPLPRHSPLTPPAEAEREIIRIDDVLHDPRTTLPKPASRRGHHRNEREPEAPVRSYLAIPVISPSGEVLGGLFFGHPAPGVFTERAQHLLAGIAAEAGIALDNARLYRAVTKSESHFRQLADAMPQIVWTATPDGRIDYFNRRWHEFTGLPEGCPDEEGWIDFLHPEDRERCINHWRKAVASGQPLQAECRLKEHHSGNHRWHLIRAVPIRDDANHVVRWFGTSTDIDGQKRAEEEVRELNAALERRVAERTAQLQASNKELEAFSYSVSHDLRAPLRSIDAFSQLVREDYDEKLDDQGRQYLDIVGEASRQMGRLIDDLLHLSRVTRSEMRRRPVDLGAIARQIIAGFRQIEPLRRVEVVIAPDLKAEGDERLLRIALENLLNNAWKFTGKQPAARIEVGQEMREGRPVFFVRDNGAGFDMTFSNKLFGAFQRLHSNNEFPGHGIGLATVQRIITRHGGSIWADSAPNQGATFYFTLPAQTQ